MYGIKTNDVQVCYVVNRKWLWHKKPEEESQQEEEKSNVLTELVQACVHIHLQREKLVEVVKRNDVSDGGFRVLLCDINELKDGEKMWEDDSNETYEP